jgi:cytochrome c-type biogenesis protein
MSDLVVAFAGGLAATVTPCILPLYPAFLAFLVGGSGAPTMAIAGGSPPPPSRRLAPSVAAVMVLAGVLVGMVAIGAVFALLSTSLTRFIGVILPIADGLLVLLGILLVAGRNPFARLPQISPAGFGRFGPVAGAFLYGLLFAPIAIPCSGPLIVAIFAYSLTVGDVAAQLGFFVVFGLGFGLPLLLLGFVAQWRGAQITRAIVRWERPIGVVLGLALVAVGIWDFVINRGTLIG